MHYLGLALVVLLVIAPLAFAVSFYYRCSKCRSFKSRMEERVTLEWGVDGGGVLKTDPYYVHTKKRVCLDCGHVTTLKTWFSMAPDGTAP